MIVSESRRLPEGAALVLTTGSDLVGFIAQSLRAPTYNAHYARRRYVSSLNVYQIPVPKELESSRTGQLPITSLQYVGVWWVESVRLRYFKGICLLPFSHRFGRDIVPIAK